MFSSSSPSTHLICAHTTTVLYFDLLKIIILCQLPCRRWKGLQVFPRALPRPHCPRRIPLPLLKTPAAPPRHPHRPREEQPGEQLRWRQQAKLEKVFWGPGTGNPTSSLLNNYFWKSNIQRAAQNFCVGITKSEWVGMWVSITRFSANPIFALIPRRARITTCAVHTGGGPLSVFWPLTLCMPDIYAGPTCTRDDGAKGPRSTSTIKNWICPNYSWFLQIHRQFEFFNL